VLQKIVAKVLIGSARNSSPSSRVRTFLVPTVVLTNLTSPLRQPEQPGEECQLQWFTLQMLVWKKIGTKGF
jgi:hypothetical protein